MGAVCSCPDARRWPGPWTPHSRVEVAIADSAVADRIEPRRHRDLENDFHVQVRALRDRPRTRPSAGGAGAGVSTRAPGRIRRPSGGDPAEEVVGRGLGVVAVEELRGRLVELGAVQFSGIRPVSGRSAAETDSRSPCVRSSGRIDGSSEDSARPPDHRLRSHSGAAWRRPSHDSDHRSQPCPRHSQSPPRDAAAHPLPGGIHPPTQASSVGGALSSAFSAYALSQVAQVGMASRITAIAFTDSLSL